jgi:outer membrane protein OmpA-like peptidoglycan-associated protein
MVLSLKKWLQMALTKLTFDVNGSVVDQMTGEAVSDATVTLLNGCGTSQRSLNVDENGNYRFDLTLGCSYVIKVEREGFFTSTVTFEVKNLRESASFVKDIKLLRAVGNPFGSGGTRTGVDVSTIDVGSIDWDTTSIFIADKIYYEFNKAVVDDVASKGLEQLLNLLQNNPEIGVEIRSHTDAKGSEDYNDRLSVRRARNVANYMIESGIRRSRLKYVGFGETQLVNACDDSMYDQCSDGENGLNRRTEFRIFKM